MSNRNPMIQRPTLMRRNKGVRRWAMEWAIWDRRAFELVERREVFFTRWGAERWLDRNTIKAASKWRQVEDS